MATALSGVVFAASAYAAEAEEAALRVEEYLADLGPNAALAAFLEQELDHATNADQKSRLATRLASLYAELIRECEDDELRGVYEARSIGLLDRVPGAATPELRLELALASYLRVRETAERARYSIVPPERLKGAADRMEALAQRFGSIADVAQRRVDFLEQRADSAPGFGGEVLRLARQQQSRARFLSGYAWSYAAVLDDSREAADRASLALGRITNPPDGPASPDDAPDQLLRVGYIAEAAVGIAFAEMVQERHGEALRWLGRVESVEDAKAHLGDALVFARFDVLVDDDRWSGAEGVFDSYLQDRVGSLDVRSARFFASAAIRESTGRGDASRDRIRDESLGELVAMGEIGHVMELVSEATPGQLGVGSFISRYARGLASYSEARETHEFELAARGVALNQRFDAPAGREAREGYARAAEMLDEALVMVEDERFKRARPNTVLLLAECELLGGDGTVKSLLGAAKRFEEASLLLEDVGLIQAARSALWRAVTIAEQASEDGGSEEIAYRDAVTALYARSYPQSIGSARVTVRLTDRDELDLEEAIERLLDVPANSSERQFAEREVSRLAHRAFRESIAGRRAWAAERFVRLS
ncbi:MAG: hypothetical protein AAGB34_10975, partial [Planctomycetota bacterium]